MKVFLSSTFLDLIPERDAVLKALQKQQTFTLAMEFFLATPTTPRETALANLRDSDLMILIIGSKAGTLLPDGSGGTYTSAEYEEALKLGKEALVFVKVWGPRNTWRNAERDPNKKKALTDFKSQVGAKWTWDTFSTPDQLALAVIQAMNGWEARGRPGARKTFASATEYFKWSSPGGTFQLLDFGTTLLGRDRQLQLLREFIEGESQRVCILSGKGGIGKSKLLHDLANLYPGTTLFLRDQPQWHHDSDKEISINTSIIVIDDAHRQEELEKALQLIRDLPSPRNIKLIISTRPGGSVSVAQQVYRKFDTEQVVQLPELEELSADEARSLAEQVLGPEFRIFAADLAQIGGNSPLVIVAGGRLIASRKVSPSALTTLTDFRSTVFGRFLEEINLHGPKFAVDPPTPILHLIAALGPVDVGSLSFQRAASSLLKNPIDEILTTMDALASHGIITPRGKPVRVIPDVLSDFILEDRCISTGNESTGYADRIFQLFGGHSLQELMRNLSELDWRRGQSRLNLLEKIWSDIGQRFRMGDEYERNRILTDITAAAIYQPRQVFSIIKISLDDPLQADTSENGSLRSEGQEHVLEALPDLLEAVAYHPEYLRQSVITLWKLARGLPGSGSAKGAQSVIKRLASWRRSGNPAFNFAMLLEAIHLAKRADAFTAGYTPYEIIESILRRDGEYSEWNDETSLTIGAFGLNYAAVGPVRESTLDYLEFVLEGDDRRTCTAIQLFKDLLPNSFNRARRITTDQEHEWQNRERDRCLTALVHRLRRPLSPLIQARIYDAVRSATAMRCPEVIRQRATAALNEIAIEDRAVVIDAICTPDHQMPHVTPEWDVNARNAAMEQLMAKAKASLGRLADNSREQARIVLEEIRACAASRIQTGGLGHFLMTFTDGMDFLSELYDQLSSDPEAASYHSQLCSILAAIREAHPPAFRERALAALAAGQDTMVSAAANNLRVFANATVEDITLLQAYAVCPSPTVKRAVLSAVGCMGRFSEYTEELKGTALAVDPKGDPMVASEFGYAFGPYGVPLTSLSRLEASSIAKRLLAIRDWSFDQGAIPRFLTDFAKPFPDETFDLLLRRIDASVHAVKEDQSSFRTFGLKDVAFNGIPQEKRVELGQRCIAKLATARKGRKKYAQLFWSVAGTEATTFGLVVHAASCAKEQTVADIVSLIEAAPPGLAFDNPTFAKELLAQFTGEKRKQIVNAFVFQARHIPGGVFDGNYEEHMATQRKQFAEKAAAFKDEPGLEDLAEAIRGLP